MVYYYTALGVRTHAFLLERRLKDCGIYCELTYVPRTIMTDLCNMGVKFSENEYPRAVAVLRQAGLPGCRLYKEIVDPRGCQYVEVRY